MAAPRSLHICQGCGYRSPKWLGRCPDCGDWDSFSEEVEERGSRGGAAAGSVSRLQGHGPATVVQPLREVLADEGIRLSTGSPWIDRVLGGGIVPGGAVLLSGEPGIGKSTLLLQMGNDLARSGASVLYLSAEESPRQLHLRASRLGCEAESLHVAGETRLEPLLQVISERRPQMVLVDSVQALRSQELSGPPGSIGQVRACADRLVELAKGHDMSLFLVGHVTKDGAIAGPKSLEHLVDTVLTFEGESHSEYRVLRAQKNRFGPTGEVAMFEMHDNGLVAVKDPSRVLLARRRGHRPGSAVCASLHGTRPLLVEVQALIHPTSFPSPRRMSVGVDRHRSILLAAVLERFGGLGLGDRDLFLNVVGGLQLKEPAADLAIAAAVLSAERERPLPPEAVFFGEVGLLGEIRPVSQTEARLREIAALGFRQVFLPPGDLRVVPKGLETVVVEDLSELAPLLLTAER